LFDKYVSVSIPAGDNIKNVVARYNDNEINLVEGINEVKSLGRIKRLDFNCKYVLLLPAKNLYYQSFSIDNSSNFRISESSFLGELNSAEVNLKDDYYFDYLEFNSEKESGEIKEYKFFAVEKQMINHLTRNLDKYRNNYLVSALPAAVYSIINEIRDESDYLLYYKIEDKYTLLAVYNNQLDLLQSALDDKELKSEIERISKYYLNTKDAEMKVLKGCTKLLKIDETVDLNEDNFIYLSSLLWSVSRC